MSGGYHEGGYGGGYHGDSFSGGYHEGGYGGERSGGYDAGGYRAGGASTGGFRESGYGDSVNRSQLNGFLGLPTDGGMHAAGGAEATRGYAFGGDSAAAWRGGATGHVYEGADGATVAHGTAGFQGAAVGPGGIAAGSRYASGTVVKGPDGNVCAHGTTAGRGFAAGPNGAVTGGYAATGRGYASAYGTRAWSPTYCRAQAIAGQGWCYGNHIYTAGWCGAHPWAWTPVGYGAAAWVAAAWTPAAWVNVGAWLGDGTTTAYGYNYGSDIVYQDGNVYYGGQSAGTALAYYDGAATLADSAVNAAPPADPQWLPLGVFGLMEENKKTPNMVFQLAVDKNGVIRGNYFDQVTQTNQSVTGAVDKKTQRVAWRVSGSKGLVVETGLYNLTQDQSTALVHYGPDRTEQELLVRMKQPSENQAAQN